MDTLTISVLYKDEKLVCHLIPNTSTNVMAVIAEDTPPSPFGENFVGKFNYIDNRWIYDTESAIVSGNGKQFIVPPVPAEIVTQILKYLNEKLIPKIHIH